LNNTTSNNTLNTQSPAENKFSLEDKCNNKYEILSKELAGKYIQNNGIIYNE